MRLRFLFVFCTFSVLLPGQESVKQDFPHNHSKLIWGVQPGVGWAYEDEAHLFSPSICLTADYPIGKGFFLQFAPQYSWLWKWNEHYLTLPLHLRKKIGERWSFLAGPSLTLDIGYFKDLGISGGASYVITRRSALVISAYIFTLYDYDIDYLYVPVSIAYRMAI